LARSTRRCGSLEKTHPQRRDVKLRDDKLRILEGNSGAGSRMRVLIESGDGKTIWGSVGVSEKIIDASWEALRESVEFKLPLG
jgi:2-isopropylmalate synthase